MLKIETKKQGAKAFKIIVKLMEKKRSLYRGKKQLDYEVPFSDKEGSSRKLKEHFYKIKEQEKMQNQSSVHTSTT